MTCRRIRAEIAALGYPGEPHPALRAHLEDCELCRRWHEDWKLTAALAAQPIPDPSPGFADRALARATGQSSGRPLVMRTGALASAAAVLLLAIGIGFVATMTSRAPEERGGPFPITRVVNVVIDAKDHRSGAVVTVELTEDLALEGYGDLRMIEWQTDLTRGRNLLALPVRMKPGAAGDLRVALSYDGGTRKEMHIPVRSG